jgi:lysozyme
MKIIKSSDALLNLIQEFEGFEPKPYLCPAGVPTIGFGSTRYSDGRKVSLSDNEITRQSALKLLSDTLGFYESQVDAFCVDTITQHQFDALVDFAYNCGVGNLKSSTLLKLVNANPNDVKIGLEFMKWVNAGGKRLNGLVKRRNAEVILYYS